MFYDTRTFNLQYSTAKSTRNYVYISTLKKQCAIAVIDK